tara:strand:- start:105 stop:365 length:261 start_codon:yes stop_codon:yes gene_type:complete
MSDMSQLEPHVNQRFHVEKSISVGHILTTIVMLVTAFSYFNDFDKRLIQAEQSIEFLRAQRAEDSKRVEKRLDSIDKKLDRLLEGH